MATAVYTDPPMHDVLVCWPCHRSETWYDRMYNVRPFARDIACCTSQMTRSLHLVTAITHTLTSLAVSTLPSALALDCYCCSCSIVCIHVSCE